MIPGFFPNIGASRRRTPSTITQPLSASSVTETIVCPGGIQAGDLIILHDWIRQASGTPAEVVPSGFTKLAGEFNTGTNSQRQTISAKIATGSEGGTTLTGQLGSSMNAKTLVVFRGDIAISAVTIAGYQTSGVVSADPAALAIASSSGATPLIMLGVFGASGSFTPTFTPAADAVISSSNSQNHTGFKIYNSAPANVSIDMGNPGSQVMSGFYLEIR